MLMKDNVCDIGEYTRTFRITPQSFLEALPGLIG